MPFGEDPKSLSTVESLLLRRWIDAECDLRAETTEDGERVTRVGSGLCGRWKRGDLRIDDGDSGDLASHSTRPFV